MGPFRFSFFAEGGEGGAVRINWVVNGQVRIRLSSPGRWLGFVGSSVYRGPALLTRLGFDRLVVILPLPIVAQRCCFVQKLQEPGPAPARSETFDRCQKLVLKPSF